MRYRKKPITIDAIQYLGWNANQVLDFAKDHAKLEKGMFISISTLEGQMVARPGDYIIKDIKGEFYSCRSDIFEESYEEEIYG